MSATQTESWLMVAEPSEIAEVFHKTLVAKAKAKPKPKAKPPAMPPPEPEAADPEEPSAPQTELGLEGLDTSTSYSERIGRWIRLADLALRSPSF